VHRAVDRQAAEDSYRDRIRHVPFDPARRLGVCESAGRQRIIAQDAVFRGRDDIYSGGAGNLIGERPPAQPVVQRGHAGIERRQNMLGRQKVRRPKLHV
jgi:hypothetical protein